MERLTCREIEEQGLLVRCSSEPLTMEQIEERNGKPVYCVGAIDKRLGVRKRYLDGWGIVNVDMCLIADNSFNHWTFLDYGADYIAYDHEPKEVSNAI